MVLIEIMTGGNRRPRQVQGLSFRAREALVGGLGLGLGFRV